MSISRGVVELTFRPSPPNTSAMADGSALLGLFLGPCRVVCIPSAAEKATDRRRVRSSISWSSSQLQVQNCARATRPIEQGAALLPACTGAA